MSQIHDLALPHGMLRFRDTGGSGFPLLLLHGSGSSKDVFSRQFDSAPLERFRLIAPDLPGHGQSADASDPEAVYTVSGLARTMSALAAHLGLADFAVFGWSLGGHVAIEMLARVPGLSGIMLTGTPPVSPGPLGMLRAFQTNFDLLLASKEHFSPRDTQRFFELCFHGGGTAAQLDDIRRADGRLRPLLVRSMTRGLGADQRRTVERTIVPTAIVNGADEPFARLSYLRNIAYGHLWDDQCHEIAGAGHAPFWDRPEQLNPLLSRFIADAERYALSRRAGARKRA